MKCKHCNKKIDKHELYLNFFEVRKCFNFLHVFRNFPFIDRFYWKKVYSVCTNYVKKKYFMEFT